MLIRESLEEEEKRILSPYACLSSQTKGRLFPEKECDIRPAFQHDRDRIIHSKAFRRLKHKTQVFLSPSGDHYRTRLTHTLEVSQIARTIAKALRFNEDLTEAIALGHDLGHTPFGHAGEAVLNEIYPEGFRHSEQSLRVVDVLENEGKGLNLTFEVRDGILKHSKGEDEIIPSCEEIMPQTLEGQIVRISDIIAYINHDLDDALRAGILSLQDIPKDLQRLLGDSHSQRINTMVKDVIQKTLSDGYLRISLSREILEGIIELRQFLYQKVYLTDLVCSNSIKASKILKELFEYFLENEERFLKEVGKPYSTNPLPKAICDFLAGMTDRFAFDLYQRLLLPQPWLII